MTNIKLPGGQIKEKLFLLSSHPHSFTDRMSTYERMVNIAMTWIETIYVNLFYFPHQRRLYDEHFPDPKPQLDTVMRNVSLVLLNSHFTLAPPRPYMPNMIEVGGLHLNRVASPLPDDIRQLLDNASEGVVFFSMGSNIQSTTLPATKRDALVRTFAKLNVKVLWKWEDDNFPDKPDNLYVRKWWPQQDILAHRNVRAFISHGGLLGSIEALYHSVPIVGIPIYGDQDMNMARAVQAGYGVKIDYKNLTETSMMWAMNEILVNPR